MKTKNFPARKQARRERAIESTLRSIQKELRKDNFNQALIDRHELTIENTEDKLVDNPREIRTKKYRGANQ